jgi:S1 RNA binding domain
VDSSIQTGDTRVNERPKWERSRLVVAAARLREFRNLEIGLKQLAEDLLPLIDDQTLLPSFWSEATMAAWGQLEVDYALAVDAATSVPTFTYPPVRENVIDLENLIEEGKRRLTLLDSPLNRFAFDQALMTWREAAKLLPIRSTVEGTVTQVTPFGFFVDLNVPFFGLVHKPDKERVAHVRVGTRLKLLVVDLSRERFMLTLPK